MDKEHLVKVYIDLPNHWAIGGESLWAKPLGKDLYQIDNVPFYAYGLNLYDTVRAVKHEENGVFEIKELVQTSGHQTFRIYFEEHFPNEKRLELLESMKTLGVSFEGLNATYFSLDVSPNGEYDEVYDYLDELMDDNIIGFETCEERVEGSFDAYPDEDE
ncbi:DUF4265 domain-containing protein [Flammeovirga sp. SJP92]|uniref:DUF4265 domain-containing protein n=1 Tax=Flammeovirga sp. SJP92 TaxID=1775430 RepID=UPI0007899916|nr:DUF4265 domain-containing protein [Flammeovirga sp. SJP92]KXX67038.1 hypothetical protein AVL50_29125 [Flammeovirga sp. SJP92]